MAVTQLADVIEPSVFESYVSIRSTTLTQFWQSGIVVPVERARQHANGEGTTFNMPFFGDLGDDESVIGSDNPSATITPLKIGTGQQIAIKHLRNQAWAAANILPSVIGEDAMDEIADKVGGYWQRQYQALLIASLRGIENDNVDNDGGDMVTSVATDSVAAITSAELISGDVIIDARQTMGDAQEMFSAIAMHSQVYSQLQKQQLISFVRDADNNTLFGVYNNMRVIVDDSCPAIAGSNRITYTSYLFGPGAFGWGEGLHKKAVEVDSEPAKGNGSGQETLYNRKQFVLHPGGFKFLNASVSDEAPTNAELALAANWDRVYDRKLIPIAIIKTNG